MTPPGRSSSAVFDRRFIGVVFLVGVVQIVYWQLRPGASLDDEIGHYLLARDVWELPVLALDFWGRPGTTLFFAPAAQIGWPAARFLALAATSASLFFAGLTARHLGVRSWRLVPLLGLAQPWTVRHGHEVITEVPAALAISVGVWLALQHRWIAVSIFAGLLPLIRHELVVVAGLWGLSLLWRREWRAALVAATPLAIWNVAAFAAGVPTAIGAYLAPGFNTEYPAGPWWWYPSQMVALDNVGPLVLFLAAIGAVCGSISWKQRWLVVVPVLAVVGVNAVVYALGSFASGGYAVFVFPVLAPLAVLAASGTEFFSAVTGRPWSMAAIAVAASVVTILRIGPLPEQNVSRLARTASAAFHAEAMPGVRVHAMNVWIYLHLPLSITADQAHTGDLWTHLTEVGARDLVVWDSHYSNRWGRTLESLAGAPVFAGRSSGDRIVVVRAGEASLP